MLTSRDNFMLLAIDAPVQYALYNKQEIDQINSNKCLQFCDCCKYIKLCQQSWGNGALNFFFFWWVCAVQVSKNRVLRVGFP